MTQRITIPIIKWGRLLAKLAKGSRTMPRHCDECQGDGCEACLHTGVVYDCKGKAHPDNRGGQ